MAVVKQPKPESSHEDKAWFLSRLLFMWATPMFRKAALLKKEEKALEQDDLLPLTHQDCSEVVGGLFETAWDTTSMKEGDSKLDLNEATSTLRLRHALWNVLGSKFILAGFIKAVNSGLQFSFPLLLNAILEFIEETQRNEQPQLNKGYWLGAILLAAMAAKAITENQYFHIVMRKGYQCRVAVSVAVYNKALRLSNSARQGTTLGELVNLMQVDATKIEMFVPQIHVLWDGVLQVTGYMTILYTLIGWPCFVGLLVMVFAAPIQARILKILFGFNRKMAKNTDTRIKITNEALQGVQSMKMNTWEENFNKAITEQRDQELSYLKSIALTRGFSRAYMSALPGIVAVASFAVYAFFVEDSNVSASRLFSALVAFEQLRFPLLFYPMALAQLAQARVSASRVENFLGMKEIGENDGDKTAAYKREESPEDGKVGIHVRDATIYWSKGGKKAEKDGVDGDPEPASAPILTKLDFEVKQGEICAIIGRVGSGKSTLCSAILNETILDHGEISLKGSVAYAAQSPWILNATLRDNILFGKPYDEERYNKVLKVCQLSHDLDLLDYGDLTEIGERGINLSGGQKQRVSVARAAYSDADIIILDDPLSALDPEVGQKLFKDCIKGFMAGKTIVFVTNQIQFLISCDNVVALKDGKIVEKGQYDELMKDENGEVKRLMKENKASNSKQRRDSEGGENMEANQESSNDDELANTKRKDKSKEKGELVTKEERNIGAVAFSVYQKYYKAGGGYLKFALTYSTFILSTGNQLAVNSWVSFWTSDANYEDNSKGFYIGIYFAFAVSLGIVTYLRSLVLALFGVTASTTLHNNLLKSVFSAPQSFFDTTPVGRIISRFSKDLYAIDTSVTDNLDFFLSMTLSVLVGLGTILYITPWFGIAVLPLGIFYFRVLNYFRDVSRETKRLESISRSPVYSQFSETLGGLTTIRAYGETGRFVTEFEGNVDYNTRAYYCNKAADRWLSTRLELIGAAVAGSAAFFAVHVVVSGAVSGQGSDANFASLAGLSLNYAISMTGMLNWCVRTFAQLEASMNGTERVLHYTENIPQEAPRTSEELQEKANSSDDSDYPSSIAIRAAGGTVESLSKEWPTSGEIVFNKLKMRYRKDTPFVLKGLNIKINSGERVGIVGRTGSGKSSLLVALFRIVEPYLAEGEAYTPPISIDGVDVLRIGLKELRSRLGIIPQNPVLFSGTIRSNVDPFDEYSDVEIWEALDQCGMKAAVMKMEGGLSAEVSEYGENLSAGMRQMLVLGRALLRKCRILLLDEATSSVDYETDREIQRTLREAFTGCTVLTIAHRIDTIMDSDKILVMADGVVAEYGPPQELLQNEKSAFSAIVNHTK